MRTCTHCGETKNDELFQRDASANGGRRNRCKRCFNKLHREMYERNKDKILKRNEEYRKKNRERINAQHLARRKRNPEQKRGQAEAYKAIMSGKLTREPCVVCGEARVDFHHTNGYDRPNWYVGKWLCRPHHSEEHKRLRLTEDEAMDELEKRL